MEGIRSARLDGIKALVLDIEGTTTPISFVKDILFGFVREHLRHYVATNFNSELLQKDISALRDLAVADVSTGASETVLIPETDAASKETVILAVTANVFQQMDNDRKTLALKQLQGHMWRSAYETGQICGALFDDVVPALQRLTSAGLHVYIYSSGSVEAQKLLFGHSTHGSLLQYLTDYFDTNVGAKGEAASYRKIADEINMKPAEILFLTDVFAEASAAAAAGLHTCLVSRHGNAPLTDEQQKTFPVITTFDELFDIQLG